MGVTALILSRNQLSKIEWHFLHESELVESIETRKTEIATAAKPENASGVRSGRPGDATGSAVVEIEHAVQNLREWLTVVRKTYEQFSGRCEGRLMELYYKGRRSMYAVCRELFISRRTFYSWRADILTYAAVKCVEAGIMKI